ncbi:unnamed protein product [Onchocerca flexuosa]|uniref:Uncharacterized protein n=1 Tax=Onchocerca flexuosa TaxID=387005 RepID=A0A3P8AVH4_9BILA|nr:unnamed protein product [Onchocerca flexuosa]
MYCIISGSICFIHAIPSTILRSKRQTHIYDESLKQYARPHPRTRIMTGTIGRYAPHEWPNWYTRTLSKWNGEFHLGPYHPNDVLYEKYQRLKNQILNSNKLLPRQ